MLQIKVSDKPTRLTRLLGKLWFVGGKPSLILREKADKIFIYVNGQHVLTVLDEGFNISLLPSIIFITEDDAVNVDAVSVTIKDFNASAGISDVVDASQADLVTAGSNGAGSQVCLSSKKLQASR